MAKIIDGKKISAEIKEELKTEVAAYAAQGKNVHLLSFRWAQIRHPAYMSEIKESLCIYWNRVAFV